MASGSTASIDQHFAELTDPRTRKVTYPLTNNVTMCWCQRHSLLLTIELTRTHFSRIIQTKGKTASRLTEHTRSTGAKKKPGVRRDTGFLQFTFFGRPYSSSEDFSPSFLSSSCSFLLTTSLRVTRNFSKLSEEIT